MQTVIATTARHGSGSACEEEEVDTRFRNRLKSEYDTPWQLLLDRRELSIRGACGLVLRAFGNGFTDLGNHSYGSQKFLHTHECGTIANLRKVHDV